MKVATNSQIGGYLAVVVSEMPGYPGRPATGAAHAVSLLVEKNQVPFPVELLDWSGVFSFISRQHFLAHDYPWMAT